MIYNKFNAIAVREYYPTHENPGNSIWVYEQVKGLSQFGIFSFVISSTPYLPKFIRKYKRLYLNPHHSTKITNYKDTYVIRPPYVKLPSKYFLSLNLFFQKRLLLKYAKLIDPKLIHAHFGFGGVASIPLKLKLNIPLVTYFYGYDVGTKEHAKKLKKLYQDLIREGDLFIALSEDMRNDLLDIGFPSKKTIVNHLGVDLELFNINKFRKTQNDKIIITSVARWLENKGGQDTITAFSKLSKVIKNVELRIIGDGPYVGELKNLIKNLKIEDRVRFINNFKAANPRETVINEMVNSDIFILTPYMRASGQKTGTPVVLMEAQALSKPCISTDFPGIPEEFDFGKSGIIVEMRNINQIYESLKMLCLDESKRAYYGNLGRLNVEKNFNQKIQISKLAHYYNSLMKI